MFDIGGAVETRKAVVDRLRALHRATAIAQAEEAFALTELFHRHCHNDIAVGVNPAHAGQFASDEAATALHMSEASVSGLIDIGLALEHELPLTRAAFTVGDIDLAHVRVIVAAVVNVDPVVIADVEQQLVDAAMSSTPVRLRHKARRWIAARDPKGERERRRRRTEDRDVRTEQLGDGVARLDGILPAVGAQTLAMRLREMSKSVCGFDPRTFSQRRADALVALADGSGELRCACGRPDCAVSGRAIGTPRKPLIQVGVSLDTLLKLREYPGFLSGAGAVDADLARDLAKDGRWELLVAAADAALQPNSETNSQTTTYKPTAALDRWIRARDAHCRFPGCNVSAAMCDIDHTCAFRPDAPDEGGLTERENLACLCRRHHRLKTDADNGRNSWRVRQIGCGRLEWTAPSGERIITTPTGADYLIPQNMPEPLRDRTAPAHETVEIPAGLPECTAPHVLERYFGPSAESWVEQDLEFLLSTLIPPELESNPLVSANIDPDEPPPF